MEILDKVTYFMIQEGSGSRFVIISAILVYSYPLGGVRFASEAKPLDVRFTWEPEGKKIILFGVFRPTDF